MSVNRVVVCDGGGWYPVKTKKAKVIDSDGKIHFFTFGEDVKPSILRRLIDLMLREETKRNRK